MLFAKFVTKDFLSPGLIPDNIDYSRFGEIIKTDGYWIDAFPLSIENDFTGIIFSEKLIILGFEDIRTCNANGLTMLINPIILREATEDEKTIIKEACCKNPYAAYSYALHFDQN